VTTIDRATLGSSAAIIAVSARYRCSTAKALAFGSEAEPADAMICVIFWSESRTFISGPSPSGVVVCALGVKVC